MPNATVGREVVRGTICRDRFLADVALLGPDRVAEGASAPMLVDVRWRQKRDEQLVPGVPEDQQPIVISFARRSEAATGEIRFEGAEATIGLAGDTRRLLTIVGARATVGAEPDVSLRVQIEGEERAALPMSVGAPTVTLAIRGETGGDPPAGLVAGLPTRLRAVPEPAGPGTFRWLSVPEEGLELVPGEGGLVEVLARAAPRESQAPPGAPPAGSPPEPRAFTLFALFDPEGDGPVAVAAHAIASGSGLLVHTERDGTGTPLADAWVYWRETGAVRTLRTDRSGRLQSGPAGSTRPSEYGEQFASTAGAAVEVAYSRGSAPLPEALVTGAFVTRTVPSPPDAPILVLPDTRLDVTQPADLGLWPLSFEPHADAYSTNGLAQGAALFTAAGALTVAEHAAAPAPAPAARPRERMLTVAGQAEPTARSVRVRLLDAAGAAVPVKRDPAAAPVEEVPATLAAGGAFSAQLVPAAPATAFGPLRLAVLADGPPRPALAGLGVHLCGVQAALVADTDATTPGPVPGEADERIVVDFLASPQASLPNISAQARARRMARYDIRTRSRPLGPDRANVLKPEMPLWMAELQLVGLSQAQLTDLMARRAFRDGAPAPLRIAARWLLTLSWDGPDSNAQAINAGPRAPQRHQYRLDLTERVTFEGLFDAQGQDAGQAYAPVPEQIAFPIEGRRLPAAVLTGRQRAWGRQGGAALPAVVVEWQPLVVDAAGTEIIRGGDGVLEASDVQLDGRALEGPLRPPAFRVRGINPAPDAAVEDLIREVVREYHTANAAQARIQLLPLACWETTVLLVFEHESGVRGGYSQFESRGSARRRFPANTERRYGHEDEMPLFGPPHGFGIGQLDLIFGRGPNDDEVWSFVENIRSGVRLLMEEKAIAAYGLVQPHLPNPVDRRTRAVYQREIVRRYNGGTEFQWSGGTFVISPSKRWRDNADHTQGPNPNLRYPNQVLGTNVTYFTNAAGQAHVADGANTQFPWPIAFTAADYGPGT